MQIPKSCPNIPVEVLNPRNTWLNKEDFDKTLKFLGSEFAKNFKNYESKASDAIKKAGPQA
jgi:phosphoenolpyruvate carboxykinase (ATP)